ncbi:MAG: polysaccharide biosynthesis protein [Deltaproteobacteria bacterium]|nr:MAG: polysaccharide biosynthesis protein [Deltaproteobacteria bacterium]
MKSYYGDKTVLITGSAGTVGTEIVRQLVALAPKELRILDNNESALFFQGNEYRHAGRVIPYLGDVRDDQKLANVTRGVDIIFHLAAFKHVGFAEYNPFEAVQTNILGVKHVAQAAQINHVSRVIFASSDKAVNPTNVMGTSKLMGERIFTAANIFHNNGSQIFSSVRFGNVLGSRGSVVPIFAKQILSGATVTVTDARMTRFVMTVQEAANLLLEAPFIACGGEVLVTKMLAMRIIDLAHAMIELLTARTGMDPGSIPIKFVGAMPGEKLYEELMTEEEVGRTKELPTMFAILPALRGYYQKIEYNYQNLLPEVENRRPYISNLEIPMTIEEIKAYLEDYGILDEFLPPGKPYDLLYPAPDLDLETATQKSPRPVKLQ